MPISVGTQAQELIIQNKSATIKTTLPLPATRDDILQKVLDIARQSGYAKIYLVTNEGKRWENVPDIPTEITEPLTIIVNPVEIGA